MMTPVDLCHLIERFLAEKKVENVVRLSLKEHTLLSDYFLIASGQSERQLVTLGEELAKLLKKEGIIPTFKPSLKNEWVIVDAGSVMVHFFLPEVRARYRLEDLWATPAQAA